MRWAVINNRFWLFLFVSLFCASPDIFAASRNLIKPSYSLEETLREAYSNNPEIRAARETVEAQKGRAVTQSSFRGPEVRFDIDPKNSLSSWEITQEFDAPGSLILKSQIAGDMV